MDQERKCLRIGLAAIALAMVFRIGTGGIWEQAIAFFARPEVASFLLYLETGRIIRVSVSAEPAATTQPTATVPTGSQEVIAPPPVSFGPEDADSVRINSHTDYAVDTEAMLSAPLQWDLTTDGPTVLILHTHATESYTQTSDTAYTPSSDYRTLDEQHNMVTIGAHLAAQLEAGGVGVIHDRTLHDHPDYTGSYSNARTTIRKYLEQYPSIRLVLDLHRDASDLDSRNQLETAVSLSGVETARLMMVVGTDAGGLNHPNWQENMALAVKLHALLERIEPGLCRPINFRSQRFNQDLSAGAMLIEVGAAGDTLTEALRATDKLAQGILALAQGASTEHSPS